MKLGIKSRTVGSVMSGAGLKAKYRALPSDDRSKGRPTPKKGK